MNAAPYIEKCPFCGGRSDFRYIRKKYHVECTVCKARTRTSDFLGEATYLWNRRTEQ